MADTDTVSLCVECRRPVKDGERLCAECNQIPNMQITETVKSEERKTWKMKLTMDARKLEKQLKMVQGVETTKTTIPVLAFAKLDTKSFTLEMTDLELSIRVPIEGNTRPEKKGDGVFLLPAKKLLQELAAVGEGEIEIQPMENHWVRVTHNGARAKFTGMAPDNFPAIGSPHAKMRQSTLSVTAFRQAVERVSFAISSEESRYTLNGALLEVKDGKARLVATDGHRLAMQEWAENGSKAELRVLIPKRALNLSATLGEEGETLELFDDDAQMFFCHGGTQLCCRKLSGQFPNYESVLPKDVSTTITVDSDRFRQALRRALPLADDRSYATRIIVQPDEQKLTMQTASAEHGEFEETFEIGRSGPAVTVGANGMYLRDVLKVAEGQITIGLKDAESAFDVRFGDGYRYILMPLRV